MKKFFFTDEEIKKIRDIIWRKTGIYIEDNKRYLIESRVSQRIEELGVSPSEYIRILMQRIDEVQKLINIITIGETRFFRDKFHFDVFFDIVKREMDDKREILCMSAGCATGEEAYTIAIYLMKIFPLKKTSVFGIDINTDFIKVAKSGFYQSLSLRDVPEEIIKAFFEKHNDLFKVKPILQNQVIFKVGNVVDPIFMRGFKNLDFIVCKNLLIYLDQESRVKVLENFWFSLRDGGILLLGPAERIPLAIEIFEVEYQKNILIYRKREG